MTTQLPEMAGRSLAEDNAAHLKYRAEHPEELIEFKAYQEFVKAQEAGINSIMVACVICHKVTNRATELSKRANLGPNIAVVYPCTSKQCAGKGNRQHRVLIGPDGTRHKINFQRAGLIDPEEIPTDR